VTSKPLLILLKQRLASCQMPGTSITESGIIVSTERFSGEIILFFRIDSNAGRNSLNMAGLRVCDCLVFYTQEQIPEEKLCFLELKSAGIGEAREQIVSTYHKIVSLLTTSHIQSVTLMAFICMRKDVPPGDRHHLIKLKHQIQAEVQYKVVRKQYKEFGSFLRR